MNPRRRDKLVYFRISEAEFAEMLKARDARGARSVSDLAREAVNAFIIQPSPPNEEMKDCVDALQTIVRELRESLLQLGSIVVACDTKTTTQDTTKSTCAAVQSPPSVGR